MPLGFVVLKAGVDRDQDAIVARARAAGARPGRRRSPRSATRGSSARLPKTRSGKILRGTMRSIAAGAEYRVPSTIDDPAILEEIAQALA